jgi:hypothetical protein
MDDRQASELSQSPIEIPKRFCKVRYDGKHYPGAPGVRGLMGGANCQHYAYEFVRAFGYAIPDLRSSGLWVDIAHTATVERPEPLDLVPLNGKPDPWGAHVGVYLGQRLAWSTFQALIRIMAFFPAPADGPRKIGSTLTAMATCRQPCH